MIETVLKGCLDPKANDRVRMNMAAAYLSLLPTIRSSGEKDPGFLHIRRRPSRLPRMAAQHRSGYGNGDPLRERHAESEFFRLVI